MFYIYYLVLIVTIVKPCSFISYLLFIIINMQGRLLTKRKCANRNLIKIVIIFSPGPCIVNRYKIIVIISMLPA